MLKRLTNCNYPGSIQTCWIRFTAFRTTWLTFCGSGGDGRSSSSSSNNSSTLSAVQYFLDVGKCRGSVGCPSFPPCRLSLRENLKRTSNSQLYYLQIHILNEKKPADSNILKDLVTFQLRCKVQPPNVYVLLICLGILSNYKTTWWLHFSTINTK